MLRTLNNVPSLMSKVTRMKFLVRKQIFHFQIFFFLKYF